MPDAAALSATATRRLVRVLAAARRPAGAAAGPDPAAGPGAPSAPLPPARAAAPAPAAPGAPAAPAAPAAAGVPAAPAAPARRQAADDPAGAGGAASDDLPETGGTGDTGTGGGVLARLSPAGAFDPGRPGRRALAAVAAVVVLGAALLAWWSRPQPEPVSPVAVATTGPPAPTTPAELVVAVSGMVHEPGLVRLPPGARVADALAAAGGPLPDADLDHLNLARKVTDGELITVGIPPAGDLAGPGGTAGPTGGLVNLNTATQVELETLPGIGPALAQRIIDYRTQHGAFRSVGELREVSGIGEVRFAELRDLVTV